VRSGASRHHPESQGFVPITPAKCTHDWLNQAELTAETIDDFLHENVRASP
jgi:hypothetical protein